MPGRGRDHLAGDSEVLHKPKASDLWVFRGWWILAKLMSSLTGVGEWEER